MRSVAPVSNQLPYRHANLLGNLLGRCPAVVGRRRVSVDLSAVFLRLKLSLTLIYGMPCFVFGNIGTYEIPKQRFERFVVRVQVVFFKT